MNNDERIFVAGHNGLVGSGIVNALQASDFTNILTRDKNKLDLRDSLAVDSFFEERKPAFVFAAAAVVGGIRANSQRPAQFLYENLQIQNNLIHAAHKHGVQKFLFLGSSCVYPRMTPQPIKEDSLLSGPLESTNEAYAIAKIAGIKMCQAYRSQYGFDAICLMPTNLYGPRDNFDSQDSHVLPALIRKCHEAKVSKHPVVEVWGSGEPRREFLYVDDMAEAALFLMQRYSDERIINVGVGKDISISELVHVIQNIVGFEGQIRYDTSMPDGTPRKLLDVSRLEKLGWTASTSLEKGIKKTYDWYQSTLDEPVA